MTYLGIVSLYRYGCSVIKEWRRGKWQRLRIHSYYLIFLGLLFWGAGLIACDISKRHDGTVYWRLPWAEIWIRPNLEYGQDFLDPLYSLYGPQRGLTDKELKERGVEKYDK
jgi:hypothetical protein